MHPFHFLCIYVLFGETMVLGSYQLASSPGIGTTTFRCPSDRPSTRTKVGIYCGVREFVHWPDGDASKIDIYLGIRYAKAAVNGLRFAKPVPPDPEPRTIFPANELPASCAQPRDTLFQDTPAARMWQPNSPLSEDCLFLNIWVPMRDRMDQKRSEKLPVMLWIYGGSFYMGTSNLSVYDGRFLAARQNVIVASLNYRVGPFGFIYTENPEVPGNMGLWDQRLAMKWVKEHINQFGGDPDRITIFGESAGAVSVSAHVISPWSHAYFRSAIMQSGSVFGSWALVTTAEALKRTKRFAKQLGCPTEDTEMQIHCMRQKSTREILEAHDAIFNPATYFSVPFPPVLDNHFLPYENGKHFRSMGHLKPNCPLMYGINKNEGSYFLLYAFVNASFWQGEKTRLPIRNRQDYLQCLRRVLDLEDDDQPQFTEPLVRYTDFEYDQYKYLPSLATWTERLEIISSDRSFKCPTISMATAVAEHDQPVYFYEFQHRTQSVPWPKWTGTMHGYEIEYVFGIPFSPQFQTHFYRFTDEERRLSDMMMTYWSNFARTGDPNILPGGRNMMDLNLAFEEDPGVDLAGDKQAILDYLARYNLPSSLAHNTISGWPSYLNSTYNYLIFEEEACQLSVASKPRERQCVYWNTWYPALLQQVEWNRQNCRSKK